MSFTLVCRTPLPRLFDTLAELRSQSLVVPAVLDELRRGWAHLRFDAIHLRWIQDGAAGTKALLKLGNRELLG